MEIRAGDIVMFDWLYGRRRKMPNIGIVLQVEAYQQATVCWADVLGAIARPDRISGVTKIGRLQ